MNFVECLCLISFGISSNLCLNNNLDVMQTYQFSGAGGEDFGYNLKVAPMTTEDFINVKHCFRVNGSAEDPAQLQSIFPDLSGFKV
jgi:hypothetical protein